MGRGKSWWEKSHGTPWVWGMWKGEMAPLKKNGQMLMAPYSVDGFSRNPARKPVEVIGTYSPLCLQGFSTMPGGCLGFFPSTCMIFRD